MMTDIERRELEIKAPSVCCPICKVSKCPGRTECEILRWWVDWIERTVEKVDNVLLYGDGGEHERLDR